MPEESRCPHCGTEIAGGLLVCPGCGALTHADELKHLAAQAANAPTPVEALAAWRRALELLPAGSRQHDAITAKVNALVDQIDRATPPSVKAAAPAHSGRRSVIGGIVALFIALVTKFKVALLFLLTNGKLLLLGLTKGGTLLSMFASFGMYWSWYGWQFAAGLILSIYVHEMGHVAELRKFGIKATAPMFIPGFGALVLLKERLHSPVEDARVGLAGPWWGLGAALAAWLWAWTAHSPLAASIAHVGAWINLLNLAPVWQLDGSRAFRALSRQQRWIAVGALLLVFLLLREGMVGLVLLVAIVRAFGSDADAKGDGRTLVDYWFLAAALAAISHANSLAPLSQLK